MTTAAIEEQIVEQYRQTSLGWQSENLKIVDKRSNLVPLVHNIAQLKVHNAMELQQRYNLPVMLLIYKARQEGVSTKIEADIFERVNRKKNCHACVVSMDDVSTNKVFNMCRIFQEELPLAVKHKTNRSNAREIKYSAPHRSSILCQTAGTKTLGRGGTTQYVHATEVTFWANAERQLLGLLQEVPDEPDTMIVLETTANGVGNAFSKRYWAAVDRLRGLYKTDENGEKVLDPAVLRGYLPIFLSWQDFPDYQIPLPKGCTEVPGMTPEIEEYVKEGLQMGVTLTKEQIYFAILTIQNKCGGSIDLFKQEYPRTAREAERSTGRMVFDPTDLDAMERRCRPPMATIEFCEQEGKVKYRHVTRRNNCWSVWKWPVKTHSYVGFGDVAEGVLSDINDPQSEPDRSVAAIMDRNAHELPITYYGRPDTIEFGDQFVLACKYYNYPWASPEMNSIGQSVLDAMKRAEYPFIYQREGKEEEVQREDTKKFGWKTTVLTRKPMIADLQQVIKERMLVVYDIRFIGEMRSFIWSPQGKAQAMAGEFDDCVITLAGLIQLHQRCPFNEDFSWADSASEPEMPVAVMGAVEVEAEDPYDLLYEDMSEFE